MMKPLMFDIEGKCKKEINTKIIISADYSEGMWLGNTEPHNMINVIRSKLKATQFMLDKYHNVNVNFTSKYASFNFE